MPQPSLHHVGCVVSSVSGSLGRWCAALSAISASGSFDDPLQRARVAFLQLPPGGGACLELVEPLSEDSPVARFLKDGGGLHHLCFEVDDLDDQIRHMQGQKAMLIRRPRPAVAFGGRRIAWMLTPEKLLVEYLERARPADPPGQTST